MSRSAWAGQEDSFKPIMALLLPVVVAAVVYKGPEMIFGRKPKNIGKAVSYKVMNIKDLFEETLEPTFTFWK